jgi:hypothetical protein
MCIYDVARSEFLRFATGSLKSTAGRTVAYKPRHVTERQNVRFIGLYVSLLIGNALSCIVIYI